MGVCINQDTDFRLPLAFSELPSTVTYRVVDVTSGTVLVADTTFSPVALTHNLDVPRAATVIDDDYGTARQIIFVWTWGDNKQATGEYFFQVTAISGL